DRESLMRLRLPPARPIRLVGRLVGASARPPTGGTDPPANEDAGLPASSGGRTETRRNLHRRGSASAAHRSSSPHATCLLPTRRSHHHDRGDLLEPSAGVR